MKTKNVGLVFLIGAIVGGVAAIFMPDKTRKQSKKFIEDKAGQLNKMLRENDTTAAAMKVFDSKSKQAVEKLEVARVMLVKNLTAVKGSIDQIDKEKYQKAVEQTIKQVKKSTKVTAAQLTKLKDYLVNDYQKIKK